MEKNSFILYNSYGSTFDALTDEEAGRLIKYIFHYEEYGDVPDAAEDRLLSILFMQIRASLDACSKKYDETREKRAASGRRHKGNQYNKTEQNGTNGTNVPTDEQNGTNGTDIVYDIDNDIDNDIDIDVPKGTINIDSSNEESLSPSAGDSPSVPYDYIVDFFNNETKGVFGVIKKPLGKTRKDHIRARVREFGLDGMVEVIRRASRSYFLKGQKGFKATFDWLILPSNFEKVLSGNYDDEDAQREMTKEERENEDAKRIWLSLTDEEREEYLRENNGKLPYHE